MNAKILLLALLLTATGLRAQTTVTSTNGLSHEELLRRAGRQTATANAETAAPGPDWAATNTSHPATASGAVTATLPATDEATRQAMAVRLAQLRATAATNNRPTTARSPRALPTAAPAVPPSPGAAPATAAAALPVPTTISATDSAPVMGNMTIRPPSDASTVPNPDQIFEPLSINWTAATLEQVLELYSDFVGRNLLRPATLPKAEIVLKQTTRLTKLEVVRMIEAALYLNQVSVVNVGEKFVTVVPTAEAFKIPGIINTNDFSSLPALGSIVTHVVQLKYTKPTEMVQILTPFASGTAANPIMAVDSSGMLVLRDNVANVKRMLEMIDKVDQVAQSEIVSEVIPIKYAKAEEIASALSSVGGGTAGSVGTRSSSSTRSSGSANRLGGGLNQTGNYNQPGAIPNAAPTPSSNATFGDRVRNLIAKAGSTGDFSILGETKIIADIRSNSLLVFASRQDMAMIKDIIGKLDVVLAQVLIETIILDVSLGNDWSLGVTAGQAPRTKADLQQGGLYNNSGQLGTLNDFLGQISTATNLNGGIFPNASGLNWFGRYGGDLDIAISALAADSRINVIQKPRIQTSHATPASIFIGQTVPYISGTYYGYNAGGSSSYQQLRVGIGLDVTPFINQDGLVVMQIQETIDDIGEYKKIDNNDVPTTTSRTLTAEVAVRDRETIVLGGIIKNSDGKSKSGVPLLKDIPLLGALFSSSSSKKSRSELMVLMRPTVLRTPEIAALQVDIEKQRLPAIRAAEKELDKVELNKANLEKEEKRRAAKAAPQPQNHSAGTSDFNHSAPFTPEEEKLLLDSQSSSAP